MKNGEFILERFSGTVQAKVYRKQKKEVFLVAYTENESAFSPLLFAEEDTVMKALDYMYDSNYEIIIGFLHESVDMVRQIKRSPEDKSLWKPFGAFAEHLFNLYAQGNLHPYYFLLFAEIVNAYKRNLCDERGNPLDDRHFFSIAQSYMNLKHHIEDFTKAWYQSDNTPSKAAENYVRNFYKQVPINGVMLDLIPDPENNNSLGKPYWVLYPSSPEDIWHYLMPDYLDTQLRLLRCENCSRFFVATGAGNPKFCNRIFEDTGKSCRQLMPKENFSKKLNTDPAERLYNRAYKTMHARIAAGAMKKDDFHTWAKEARQHRDLCKVGQCTLEAYSTWLCDSGLFIDYLKGE